MAGINAKNKNTLDEKFICPMCALIIRGPIQLTQCGHRICQSCLSLQQGTTIRCPECMTETQRNQLLIDRGFKVDMQSLPIECSFCQWIGVLNDYQDHTNHFHPNPKCVYCDEQFSSVNQLNEHTILECPKTTVYCVLREFGCDKKIVRCKIWDHYSNEQHQNSLLKCFYQMQLQRRNEQKSLVQTGSDLTRSTSVVPVDPSVALLEELCDLNKLVDDGQTRLNNTLLQCQKKYPTLTLDFLRIKLSVLETNSSSNEVKHNEDILNQDLATLKEKVNDMKYTPYNGTFIWKIPNFQEKMTDAQSERQTSIYSPPFYSSPTGYKMRARLYLHGDGNARRTHISLFFVLMRGLNDSILKFPFNYKVTFCMYDQTGAQRHIIDSFRPDIRSNSFTRPRSDMNIASGIPKFFPLAMIQQENNPYVRDDTMFIKVLVDFGDIPRTLLPYALSLNPGLPTLVQLTMIRQEAERRAQQQPDDSN